MQGEKMGIQRATEIGQTAWASLDNALGELAEATGLLSNVARRVERRLLNIVDPAHTGEQPRLSAPAPKPVLPLLAEVEKAVRCSLAEVQDVKDLLATVAKELG